MNNNIMNNNNMNNNNMNNNQKNQVMNFTRRIYRLNNDNDASVMCIVEQNSESIDKNEVNEIKNIVQISYTTAITDPSLVLSDCISEQLKQKLQGDWFVFVSEVGKKIDYCISTVSASDFLIIKLGTSRFVIAKIQ